MPIRDEGIVKYQCTWRKAQKPDWSAVKLLDAWRSRCFDLRLVGVYPDGVGYGNLSCRIGNTSTFWVTGSATGSLPRLGAAHYTKVLSTSPERNEVECEGPIQASSESMTHAVIYNLVPEARAVIHVHSKRLWTRFLHRVPTTPADVPYGTPEMCAAVGELLAEATPRRSGLFVMAGHEEGLVTFGESLQEAGDRLLAAVAQEGLPSS